MTIRALDLPGPSRTVTVEPVKLPEPAVHPAERPERPERPEREPLRREPEREPVPA